MISPAWRKMRSVVDVVNRVWHRLGVDPFFTVRALENMLSVIEGCGSVDIVVNGSSVMVCVDTPPDYDRELCKELDPSTSVAKAYEEARKLVYEAFDDVLLEVLSSIKLDAELRGKGVDRESLARDVEELELRVLELIEAVKGEAYVRELLRDLVA